MTTTGSAPREAAGLTRILVVEDEALVAKDLQLRLRKLGYEVPKTVQTGDDAVRAADELRPALILMDIRLKGHLDGVETSLKISEKRKTPVIFLTAYADDSTLARAKVTEPYGFVLKPFNERELHTAIQVALQRHQAEAALRKSERWLAATLRSIGDAIIAVDTGLNVLFMNPLAQALTGWSEAEATGRKLAEVFRLADDGSRPVENAIARALRDGKAPAKDQIFSEQSVLVARDGSQVPIEDNAAPILDDEGAVAGGVLVFRDITQGKQAEEARRESEQQLRTLANSITQLAWMADPDGSISWYNQRWFEYTGKTREEMLGWGWQSVHDAEMLPEVLRRWKESLQTGTPFDMEFPLRGADGKFRWFLTRVAPVSDSQSRIVRWFGTNTDIHEAREIRERLLHANTNLAEFAYSASHDLQEPLRNVAIYSQLLHNDYAELLDEQGTLFLSFITGGAKRMERLVLDLLSYAESGMAPEEPVDPVEASDVLEEVLSGLATSIAESGAVVTADKLPAVRIRRLHLYQLFQNLIGNAIKYRSAQSPEIRISADAKGSEWIFSISDNGIGIDPEYYEPIFGLFKRLHGQGDYPGTGVGLALCRNIVGLYGGGIRVESAEGGGSTFYFALPQ